LRGAHGRPRNSSVAVGAHSLVANDSLIQATPSRAKGGDVLLGQRSGRRAPHQADTEPILGLGCPRQRGAYTVLEGFGADSRRDSCFTERRQP
jgi:hypothetical protein